MAGKKRKHGDDLIPVGGASLGDRVVALYRGDEANQWFPGRVTAVHSDDTYDIKYTTMATRTSACLRAT